MGEAMADNKAVVFDLDGTLIDSVSVIQTYFLKIANKFKRDGVIRDDDFLRYNGLSTSAMVMALISEKKINRWVIPYIWMNKRRIRRQIESETDLFPGTLKCLDNLGSLPLAIATSSDAEHLTFNLDKFNLSHYFSCFVSGNEIEKKKPEPDIYLLISRKLGINPENCVAIEDSVRGVTSAKRAGFKCIAVLQTMPRDHFSIPEGPDWIIPTLRELDAETIHRI